MCSWSLFLSVGSRFALEQNSISFRSCRLGGVGNAEAIEGKGFQKAITSAELFMIIRVCEI